MKNAIAQDVEQSDFKLVKSLVARWLPPHLKSLQLPNNDTHYQQTFSFGNFNYSQLIWLAITLFVQQLTCYNAQYGLGFICDTVISN